MKYLLVVLLLSAACQLSRAQDAPVYLEVDQHAEFKGGQKGWSKFLRKNLKYPMKAKKAGVQGKAFISFVVEKDGSISRVDVVRAPSEELGEEASRVVWKSKKWQPAKHKGEIVRSRVQIQIVFKLS